MNRRHELVHLCILRQLVLLSVLFASTLIMSEPPTRAATSPVTIGGPFTLSTPDGTTVTDQTYRGKWLLVYFGYTFCPNSCPTTLLEVATALKKLGPDAAQVQPLFITVDPQRDTPKTMADYVSSFSSRIIGLSGSPQAIEAAEKAYRVFARKGQSQPDGDYSMDHSSIVYLMDKSGAFVEAFNVERPPEEAAKDLERFL